MSFGVEQDCDEPKMYDVVDAAILFKGNESVQLDMKAGILSVSRALLGEHLAPAVNGTSNAPALKTLPSEWPKKNFTAVVWGVGDKRISTPISALTLLNVTSGNKLFLCSDSAKLAGAVNASVGHDARNRTGREVVEQGSLDCGTLASESFCIVGHLPLGWSAGGRAVLVAAHWTPQFFSKTNNKVLVCAQIGEPLPVTPNAAASSQLSTVGILIGVYVASGVLVMGWVAYFVYT